MSLRIILGTLMLILVVATGCATTLEGESDSDPRFRLTVEEAGFVAKGELFHIYGDAADPVIVTVDASTVDVEGQPGWQLDTVVQVHIDREVQERRWRFWVALDPDGFPAVIRREDISRGNDQ